MIRPERDDDVLVMLGLAYAGDTSASAAHFAGDVGEAMLGNYGPGADHARATHLLAAYAVALVDGVSVNTGQDLAAHTWPYSTVAPVDADMRPLAEDDPLYRIRELAGLIVVSVVNGHPITLSGLVRQAYDGAVLIQVAEQLAYSLFSVHMDGLIAAELPELYSP